MLGCLLPLIAWATASLSKAPGVYLFRFFAGFCLVTNGIYIGVGWLIANGADPWVMMENGSSKWLLVLFGVLTIPAGFYLWHREDQHFGLGAAKGLVNKKAAVISTALLITLVAAELIANSK